MEIRGEAWPVLPARASLGSLSDRLKTPASQLGGLCEIGYRREAVSHAGIREHDRGIRHEPCLACFIH